MRDVKAWAGRSLLQKDRFRVKLIVHSIGLLLRLDTLATNRCTTEKIQI